MPPEILYKFRDWEDKYHKRILTHNEMYFSSCANFNDPFDSYVPIRLDQGTPKQIKACAMRVVNRDNPTSSKKEKRKIVSNLMKKGDYKNPENVKRYIEYQRNVFRKHGIFSASILFDNILLWSHYSNNHKGFCIGLDYPGLEKIFEDHYFKTEELIWGIYKVEYYENIPNLMEYDLSVANAATKPLLIKSRVWEYEKEYRIILGNINNKAISFDDNVLNKVILGCKMEAKHKEEIKEILKSKSPRPELFEAKMKEEDFGLDFVEVSY